MFKIKLKVVEIYIDKYKHVLEMRGDFLRRHDKGHAKDIRDEGAPLDKCTGFISCTKIGICRPFGYNAFQRAMYLAQKRVHYLIYQSITTPDGLTSSHYDLIEEQSHDLTLLR